MLLEIINSKPRCEGLNGARIFTRMNENPKPKRPRKPLEPWQKEDAERLKEIYLDKIGGMSQEEFADKFEIGTQGMVWQYLNGYSPLNLEAAIKFARALRCTIGDFSPSLEQVLRPAFSDGLVTGVRTDYSSEATKVMEIFESLDRDGRKSVQDCAEKEKLIIELKSAQPTEVKKFG